MGPVLAMPPFLVTDILDQECAQRRSLVVRGLLFEVFVDLDVMSAIKWIFCDPRSDESTGSGKLRYPFPRTTITWCSGMHHWGDTEQCLTEAGVSMMSLLKKCACKRCHNHNFQENGHHVCVVSRQHRWIKTVIQGTHRDSSGKVLDIRTEWNRSSASFDIVDQSAEIVRSCR